MPKPKAFRDPESNTVPARFIPKFWCRDADLRSFTYKQISKRYEALKADAGVDSVQRDLLAQRATFIALQIETMEVDAMAGRDFNAAVYTQMVNTLQGLLAKLGLERRQPKTIDVKAYLRDRDEEDDA